MAGEEDREVKRKKILVVDDHEDIRTVMSMVLESRGFLIKTAPNGEKALELCRHEDFDFILTDYEMGKERMNGVEFARRVVEELGKSARIFLITAATVQPAPYIERYFQKPAAVSSIIKAMEK